jgi:hypothetical protein
VNSSLSPASAGYDPDEAGEDFASDFDDVEGADDPPVDEAEDVEVAGGAASVPFFSPARESVR